MKYALIISIMKYLIFLLTTTLFAAEPVWQQRDKQIHFVAGAAAGSLTYALTKDHCKHPRLMGFMVGASLGLAKELRDRRQTGNHFDTKDLLATALGGSVTFTYRF